MKCAICGKDKRIMCLCGFCQDCIEEHGHDKCSQILKEKQNENQM